MSLSRSEDGKYDVETYEMGSTGQVLIRYTGGPAWRWFLGLGLEMWRPASPDEIRRYHR